jgi:hypothetical protein
VSQLENPMKFAAYKNRYSASFILTEEQKQLIKSSWEALLNLKVSDKDEGNISGITIFFEYVFFFPTRGGKGGKRERP